MTDVLDPPAAPEGGGTGGLRAKNLRNLPCVLQPQSLGQDEGTDGLYDYIACSVWVLDRSGVVEHGENVRISWWKAKDQLKEYVGKGVYIACRPIEGINNSIELAPLSGDAKKVAESVVADLKREASSPTPPPTEAPDENPF